jgi:hypothetical protein
VGDFSEAEGSAFQFWIAVLRTLLGTALRQWTVLALAKAVLLTLLCTAAVRIFFMSVTMTGARYIGLGPMNMAFGPTRRVMTPVLVGWMAARLLPGRESSVWAAGLLIACAVSLTGWMAPSAMPSSVAPTFVFSPTDWLVLLAAVRFAHYKKWARAAGLLPLLPVLLVFFAALFLHPPSFRLYVAHNVLLPNNSLTLLFAGALLARVETLRRRGALA